jgi:hypothetical protein
LAGFDKQGGGMDVVDVDYPHEPSYEVQQPGIEEFFVRWAIEEPLVMSISCGSVQ